MKADLEAKALLLRRSGKGIKHIARTLGVSSSTASRWCKPVVLSKEQIATLALHQRTASLEALRPWIERNKNLKKKDIAHQALLGGEDLGKMSDRDLFMLGLGLYWGEGYKRGSQECGFTNSDPQIIRTILRWFSTCYDIKLERISARLTINSLYKEEESRLREFWAKETGIPRTQFASSTFITGYGTAGRDGKTYTGTLRIKVRNGTSLRRRILASIACVD